MKCFRLSAKKGAKLNQNQNFDSYFSYVFRSELEICVVLCSKDQLVVLAFIVLRLVIELPKFQFHYSFRSLHPAKLLVQRT